MNKNVIIQHYDSHLYNTMLEEYFEGSDYANFGYWEEDTRSAKQACDQLMEKLLSFIPEKKGSILDVACGKGATTRYLTNYFPEERITAVNISEKQLRSARQAVPGGNFLMMDAARLAFKDNSFNQVICVEAVFHFYTREQFFREALRILKPQGYLVLTDVLLQAGAEKKMRSFHDANSIEDRDRYESLCREIGFRKVRIIDATRQSWHGHFWSAVTFIHAKYLKHEIDLAAAQNALDKTYRITPDLKAYLLVCLQK